MNRIDSRGYGYLETCLAIVILGLLAQSIVLARLVLARQTVILEDRSYARMKTLQMMEELKGQANADPWSAGAVLDEYADSDSANPILTTDKMVDKSGGDPGDPVSGNRKINGHWRYVRKVEIHPAAGNPGARWVDIRIWLFGSDQKPLLPGKLLSEQEEMFVPEGY